MPCGDPFINSLRNESLHRFLSDAPRRRIDDTQKRYLVVVRIHQAEIGQRIANLFAIEKRHTSNEHVGKFGFPQFRLECSRLLIRAKQDCDIPWVDRRILESSSYHGDHFGRLLSFIGKLQNLGLLPHPATCPQDFVVPLRIKDDQPIRHFNNGPARTIIVLETDHFCIRPVTRESQNMLHFSASPAIDGLVVVANHAEVSMALCQPLHNPVLASVRILIFIHKQMIEEARFLLTNLTARLKQIFGQ